MHVECYVYYENLHIDDMAEKQIASSIYNLERVITVKKPVNITRHLASCGVRVFLIMILAALFALPAFAQEDLWEELNDKASQLLQERRYADAIKVCEEAIKVATETFAPNHPCIAISKNLLGTLYWTYGRFSEAEPLFRQALAIYEEGLVSATPPVAPDLQNLADMYLAQDRYAEAEPLYRQAIEIYENAFGPDDPRVVAALNSLGGLFQDQGE